ncbi:universal stress protein [Flindersiella endophytica]
MEGRIVVGIDDTVEAWIALHWAIQEALARHCEIRIVHVYDKDRPRAGGGVRAEQEILDAAVGIAHQRVGASSATGALVLGDAVEVLAGESARAMLVVVGSRRRAETYAVHLESVSAGLVGRANCPVMTVREGLENRPVVVGVKDLAAPDGMLRFAFAEAHERGRRLSVVHFDLTGGGSAVERELVEAARTLGGAYPSVDLAVHVLPGDPVAGLIGRSGTASLVVVGAPATDAELPSGSGRTSQQVLYGAQSSVAVVPEPAQAVSPRGRPSWMFGSSYLSR